MIARAEQGKFALVRANWNSGFLDELGSFPEGQHDDRVDATTGGMTMLGTSANSAGTVRMEDSDRTDSRLGSYRVDRRVRFG